MVAPQKPQGPTTQAAFTQTDPPSRPVHSLPYPSITTQLDHPLYEQLMIQPLLFDLMGGRPFPEVFAFTNGANEA
jgi:hypothetical protein